MNFKITLISKIKDRPLNTSDSLPCVQNSAKSILVKHDYNLQELNDHLSDKSYLDNTVYPTELDNEAFKIIKKRQNFQNTSAGEINSHLPHFFRWFRHISSFTESQRLSFLTNVSQLDVNFSGSQNPIENINNRVCAKF